MSEWSEQVEVARYLDAKGILWIHTPHGGRRSAHYGALMMRAGVGGAPDLIILEPPPEYPDARGVMIELKRKNGGTTAENQLKFLRLAEPLGWMCRVCFGSDETKAYLHSLGW